MRWRLLFRRTREYLVPARVGTIVPGERRERQFLLTPARKLTRGGCADSLIDRRLASAQVAARVFLLTPWSSSTRGMNGPREIISSPAIDGVASTWKRRGELWKSLRIRGSSMPTVSVINIQAGREMQSLFDDGDQNVGGDGDPDL